MSFPFMKLGDAVIFKGGGTPSRDQASYWNGGIPWATVKDLNDGYALRATQEHISQEGLARSASNLVPAGTVIISTRMALGKAVLPEIDIAINQDLKAVIPTVDLDSRFLLWYFIANGQRIEAMGKGATVKGVTLDQLRALQIPLPPLAQQRRIAAILGKTDALRAQRRAAIAKLDELLQSVFIEMFEQSEETDWDEMTIADVVDPIAGMRTGPFGSQLLHSEFVSEGVAVLGIDNAVSNEFRWGERRFIREEKYRTLKRYTVRPGDVLITIMGTNGRCAVVPKDIPLAINTKHLCCITLDKSKCLPEFLHSYFLRHSRAKRYLGGKAKGAIMAGLNMGIIKAMPIQLPPVKLQKRFADIAARIEAQKQTMQLAAEKTENLFASLQQLAFSDKL